MWKLILNTAKSGSQPVPFVFEFQSHAAAMYAHGFFVEAGAAAVVLRDGVWDPVTGASPGDWLNADGEVVQ